MRALIDLLRECLNLSIQIKDLQEDRSKGDAERLLLSSNKAIFKIRLETLKKLIEKQIKED